MGAVRACLMLIRMYYFPRPNVWGVNTSRSPRARCGVVASY